MATREHGLFRAIDHPSHQHANESCIVYGTTGKGVDLGIELEGYGALFLSDGAILEIAEVAGYSVNAEGQAVEEENAHLQHRVAELEEEVASLNEELEAVAKVMARKLS